MNLRQENKSFRQAIEFQAYQFIEKASQICQDNQIYLCHKTQIFETIMACFDSPEIQQELAQNEYLPNFLEATLNNESEKRLKKKIGIKEITQVSGSTKLFGKKQESYQDESKLHQSFISNKSAFSYDSHRQVNHICFQNLNSIWKPKQQQSLNQLNQEKENSDINLENRCFFQSKKIYKVYPTPQKLEIISYGQKHGMKEASQRFKVPIPKINVWSRSFSKSKGTRGRKPIDPEMEEKVCQWLNQELSKGTILTQKIIREKAKEISGSQQFKASKGWLQKFFKRRPQLFKSYTENRMANKSEKSDGQVKIEERMKDSFIYGESDQQKEQEQNQYNFLNELGSAKYN